MFHLLSILSIWKKWQPLSKHVRKAQTARWRLAENLTIVFCIKAIFPAERSEF